MYAALPACVKIYSEFSGGETPVTVKGTKYWLERHVRPRTRKAVESIYKPPDGGNAVVLDNIWFSYGRKTGDVLKGVSLKVKKGILYSIVGGNGAGKSTLLSIIGGINRPYRGKVTLLGRDINKIDYKKRYNGLLGFLPQEPQNLFRCDTVKKDLKNMAISLYGGSDDAEQSLNKVIQFFSLGPLLARHPFDLSGGEQQCAALAKVMLTRPEIILLDEPTKGMDFVFKKKLSGLFSALKKAGKTIIMVSHDIDFCAECSDFSALMFCGEIISDNISKKFFAGNSFYTTSANRIARGVFPDAVTCEDVIRLCRENPIGG